MSVNAVPTPGNRFNLSNARVESLININWPSIPMAVNINQWLYSLININWPSIPMAVTPGIFVELIALII